MNYSAPDDNNFKVEEGTWENWETAKERNQLK